MEQHKVSNRRAAEADLAARVRFDLAEGVMVAEAQKVTPPAMFMLLTVTRLLPQPASEPNRQKARAVPLPSVTTCSISEPGAPEVADSWPSLRVTSKVTTLPANGVTPSWRNSCTSICAGSSLSTGPLWLLPPTTCICAPLGGL